MKNSQLLTTQLTQLLNKVKNRLPPDDIKNIVGFIEDNEFGLAYETLCTQLYEYNIQISCEFYEEISCFGQSIKIQPSIWRLLQELTINK